MSERVKIDGCVNCRICEMACSLHHTGVFSYKYSSISVGLTEDGVGIFFKEPFSCDTCEGEGEGNYQCVKYCYRAKDALKAFIVTQGEGGDSK